MSERRASSSNQKKPAFHRTPSARALATPASAASAASVPLSTSLQWDVTDVSLPAAPPYYPLATTSVFLPDSTENNRPSLIAGRISQCLRDRSISAAFNTEGPATAQATNMEHVDFSIRLFSDNREEQSGSLVEVTRGRGCVMSFYQDCSAILHAARGIVYNDPQEMRVASAAAVAQNAAREKDNERMNHGDSDAVLLALENIEDLLKKDRVDANMLGIQSLYMLTDPTNSNQRAAAMAAKAMLFKQNGNELLHMVESLVRDKKLSDDDDFEDEIDSDGEEDKGGKFDEYYMNTMHNVALGILANALTLLASEGTAMSDFDPDCQLWFKDDLIPILLAAMAPEVAGTRPHDAFLAVKCLTAISRLSKEMGEKAVDLGAVTLLDNLQKIGCSIHAKLAHESEIAMTTLVGK